ncbi:LPS export ABC transporter periplasmic protein LptC [Hwanghaeella sp.]|uniref:LPS export ABC transporter periplasmic protein LptC n=1 Tax=Hwanghaeella sp. TaxID=2605943 RepID=UPI003CCBE077
MAAAEKTPQTGRQRQNIPLGTRSTRIDRSYGRMVQFLKVVLPTVALMLIALLIAWPRLSEQTALPGLQLFDIDGNSGDSMQLSNARYQGVDDKNQPYTVTADKVRQENLDSNFVNLEGPKADIMMTDQSWAAVTALTGVFNREAQILDLAGNVNFFHDLGYEIRTESAQLDIVEGHAVGDVHVEGQGPFGQFVAEGFEVFDRGARVLLTGKSRLLIYPDADQ